MKLNRALVVIRLIAVVALISTGYCAWLTTVPISYNMVPVVLIGLLVSFLAFVGAVIGSIIVARRLRRSRSAADSPEMTPHA